MPTGNLDSLHGNAVMAVLRELDAEGATLVLVTHSAQHAAQHAAQAGHTVRLLDGRLLVEALAP